MVTTNRQAPRVRVELFGVPRLVAGLDAIEVEAATVHAALLALAERCPALAPSVIEEGRLSPAYVVAINGTQFDDDPERPLRDGDAVVILSAQAGG